MSEELIVRAPVGEWNVIPQSVCRVTGTVYHETMVLGFDRTEYPCCDLAYTLMADPE